MGKTQNGGKGFSVAKPPPFPKRQAAQAPADQVAKEQQAVALINQNKLQEAEAIYRELIAIGTNNYIVYGNLAAICGTQGRYDELIELLTKTLELNPSYTEAYINLGTAFQKRGDFSAAIASSNKALELEPSNPIAHSNLGNALQEQGEHIAAIASYKKALQLNPNYPEAHYNLGNALKGHGDLPASITSYNKALKLNPNYPEAHNNLGLAFQEQGDLITAIASYKKALQLNPNYPDAHYNLGVALQEQGDLIAAIASYNKALELNPRHPEAQWNSSLTMLLSGDYKKGWEKYEWRTETKKEPSKPHAQPKCRLWDGSTLDPGKQILLVSEQGLGDTIQFMRYAIALREQGASVSICAQPKLHTLIQASGINASPLTPQQANKIKEGQWLPLLSAPRHLEVSPDKPIITKPYIKATDDLNSKWKRILSAEGKPIIGINWQGNPKTEKTGLRGRSLPLEAFAAITTNSHIALLSLQKGCGSEQLGACSFRDHFVSCQQQVDETWDFLETAAIITNCDLVITSDTSVAHLAGGMGKTTWLLLHKVPDWRWGLEGVTTFWYPSMRLFRQRERGNWNEVLQRVAEALQEEFPDAAATESTHPRHRQIEATAAAVASPQSLPQIKAPISLGELIDKITILQIKAQHLQGNALENVRKELTALQETLDTLEPQVDPRFFEHLKKVNSDLWEIEDGIRDKERNKDFGEGFIHLARSVYQQNDRRAAIKKEINTTYGSALTEEKSYQDY